MIAAFGSRTTIIENLREISGHEVVRMGGDLSKPSPEFSIPFCKYYVLAAGVLHQKPISEQTDDELMESLFVNMIGQIKACEHILESDANAQIVVIGSRSGVQGSYDMTYACCKAGIHLYVKTKKTHGNQRINCIAPWIIKDSGMTERRKDYPEVLNRQGLTAARDVAIVVQQLLFTSSLNNQVIV